MKSHCAAQNQGVFKCSAWLGYRWVASTLCGLLSRQLMLIDFSLSQCWGVWLYKALLVYLGFPSSVIGFLMKGKKHKAKEEISEVTVSHAGCEPVEWTGVWLASLIIPLQREKALPGCGRGLAEMFRFWSNNGTQQEQEPEGLEREGKGEGETERERESWKEIMGKKSTHKTEALLVSWTLAG